MFLNRREWMIAAAAIWANLAWPARADDPPAKPTSLPVLTPGQIREDLSFLQSQWAPLEKSFTAERRDAFDQLIAKAMTKAEGSSFEDLILDVMQAVAIPRNGHTAPMVGSFLDALPIRTWWFSDGLYVVSSAPHLVDLLGARLEAFGPMTAADAQTRVASYISGIDQRIRYLGATYLMSPMVLRRIGAAPSPGDIPLTVRLRNGEMREVGLSAVVKPDPLFGSPNFGRDPVSTGWSALIPGQKDQPDRWSHVLDRVDKFSPTYAKPTVGSTEWMGDDGNILYVRSNLILSTDKERLDEDLLFGVLQNLVVAKRPRFAVVDLRLNNGGNFFETLLFAEALPKLMPPGGRVFVLVSRATFSAALTTAAMLKRADPDKVTLMGEHMGDDGHFWAEPQTKTLPNSKIPVRYCPKFEDYEHGCPDLDKCYWPAAAFVQGTISVEPDVKIDVSFADYAAGRDPVLEAALARAK